MLAVLTAKAQKAVGQHSALEKSFELFCDMRWEHLALTRTEGLKGPQVILHHTVEQAAFGPTALIKN